MTPAIHVTCAHTQVAAVIRDEICKLPVATFGLPLPKEPHQQRIVQALITDPADERDVPGRWP